MNAHDLRVEEAAAPYLVAPVLTDHLDTFAGAPDGFKRLRELVLNLAVRGRLTSKSMGDGLPAKWSRSQFGDCAEVVRGITFPASEKSKTPEPGRVACLRTANIQNEVEWDDLLYVRESFLSRSDQLVCQGDLIMSMANSKELVGKVAQVAEVPFPCAIGGFLAIIRGTKLSNDYLLILLRSPDVRASLIDSSTQTTNIANISLSRLCPLPVAVPPLAEQSRIVAKVEELMALIDRLETKVSHGETARGKLLDALLAALADSPDAAATADAWAQLAPHFDLLLQTPADVDRLQQTLLTLAVKGRLVPQDPNDEPAAELLKRIRTEKERLVAEEKIKREKPLPAIDEDALPYELPQSWQWTRLGSIGDSFDYGTSQKASETPRGVPVLRMGNVQAGTVTLTNLKYFEDGQGELPHLYLQPGDLLFNRTNSYELVGKTGIFEGEPHRYSFASYLIRVRANTRAIDPQYLNLYMNSRDCRLTQIEPQIVQQNGQANFNGTKLQNICVPLPPLPEQSRIVAAVASLTALCDRLRERLAARRDLSAKVAAALTESALQ